MGKYDKMTNNLDNETLKAKSSRMKIKETLEIIKTAMDYLEKKRLEHENLDAQGKAKLYAGIIFPSYFDSQKILLERLKETLTS